MLVLEQLGQKTGIQKEANMEHFNTCLVCFQMKIDYFF